uniref:Arginyl-tRNA--protein transferase 1 n=1 Tax=Vannella robusta TaxID=1487602 RepID=A0A7S4IGM9_9EUKA
MLSSVLCAHSSSSEGMNNSCATLETLHLQFPGTEYSQIQLLLDTYPDDIPKITHILEQQTRKQSITPGESVIQLFEEFASECHYCPEPSPKGRVTYEINAEKLTVADYQQLIDKGWRRNGSWVYHPSNDKSCCPHYTIRLDVNKFQASKSQKRCSKRWKRFLAGEIGDPQNRMDIELDDDGKPMRQLLLKESQKREIEKVLFEAAKLALESFSMEHLLAVKHSRIRPQVSPILHKKKRGGLRKRLTTNFCLQFTPHAPSDQYSPLSLAEKMLEFLPYHWDARAAGPGFINFKFSRSFAAEPSVSQKEQEEGNTKDSESEYDFHHFELTMDQGNFSNEKFQLYKKYQMEVHNDNESDLTIPSFQGALCTSPLIHEPAKSRDDPECGYGSFHQNYRVDGELIAVGVIDVLPNCVSSVYFFYNPSYSWLSPGVISALQEIQWVKNFALSHSNSKLHYYYMGYYIHDCPKMKYKKSYQPSDLLCPITHKWVSLGKVERSLDAQKYCRLSNEKQVEITKQQILNIAHSLKLIICGSTVTLRDLTTESQRVVLVVLEKFILIVGSLACNFRFLFK